MNTINLKITKNILGLCIEDYIDLLTIKSIVNETFLNRSKEQKKRETLLIIKSLLEKEFLSAGWLLSDLSFKSCNDSPYKIIKKIDTEWSKLNRDLHPHEIIWFYTTQKGKKEFEYLNNLPELKETDLFYFDGEIGDILNIIKPHGYLIGKKDINSYIRFLKEGKNEAFEIFNKLTENGKIIYQNDKKIISKLSDNLYVIYRPSSELGSTTIDIRARDFRRNIKLKFGDLHE